MTDKAQPIPVAERVRAGFFLGDLGDPRFPVTIEQWRAELARAGEPGSYFCRVESGTYWIGSSDNETNAMEDEKPIHQFTLTMPIYIARYPITNAQWDEWGQRRSYTANNSDLNRPSQPVVAIERT